MLLDWKKYLTVWLTLLASSYLLHYIAVAAIMCAFSGAHMFSSNVFVWVWFKTS
jgi:hypothetical protein